MKTRMFFRFLLATLLVLAVCEAKAHASDPVVTVNCAKPGHTITKVLNQYQLGPNPLTITVEGTCNENVLIARNNVTLIASPSGGTVIGANANEDTITVTAGAVGTVIDGLTVENGTVPGGWNGITVLGSATIQNCTVQNANRSGIFFYHGGQGTVDTCTVQNNGSFGIIIEGASATVTNSTISLNSLVGIHVTNSSSARIGVTLQPAYAGNTIRNNGGSGILVSDSSSAFIGGNTITGNGTNLSSTFGQFGIFIVRASAEVVGYNSITGNSGSGVFAVGSSVAFGNQAFGLPTTGASANVISGNGATGSNNGGILGFLGSSLYIQSATIQTNTGDGVILSTRSTATMFSDTVSGNTGNGISLWWGGALLLQDPAVTVTGNASWGLQCTGSTSGYLGDNSGITGNTAGNVSSSCTGF